MSAPLIIGGGPAGASAAIKLARAGRSVTLIERNAESVDKVCGDFVSGEAIDALGALGVALPDAAPIAWLRLVHGNRLATARLPFAASGITRRMLDETLLRTAAANGATIMRGRAVRNIQVHGDALSAACDGAEPIMTDTIFLATGKHDLRGVTRDAHDSGLVGMKMYFQLDATQRAALHGHVELVLFAGGYAGLQAVEADRAVLCALVPRTRLRAVGGRWDTLLDSLAAECPHLAHRLSGARALLDRPLAIAGLPYGFVHAPRRGDPPGLFRLGDQAAVIPSFTGDGVALALASGTLAARCWLENGAAAGLYHRRHATLIARQMRLATIIQSVSLRAMLQRWLVLAGGAWPSLLRGVANATRCNQRLTHIGYASMVDSNS